MSDKEFPSYSPAENNTSLNNNEELIESEQSEVVATGTSTKSFIFYKVISLVKFIKVVFKKWVSLLRRDTKNVEMRKRQHMENENVAEEVNGVNLIVDEPQTKRAFLNSISYENLLNDLSINEHTNNCMSSSLKTTSRPMSIAAMQQSDINTKVHYNARRILNVPSSTQTFSDYIYWYYNHSGESSTKTIDPLFQSAQFNDAVNETELVKEPLVKEPLVNFNRVLKAKNNENSEIEKSDESIVVPGSTNVIRNNFDDINMRNNGSLESDFTKNRRRFNFNNQLGEQNSSVAVNHNERPNNLYSLNRRCFKKSMLEFPSPFYMGSTTYGGASAHTNYSVMDVKTKRVPFKRNGPYSTKENNISHGYKQQKYSLRNNLKINKSVPVQELQIPSIAQLIQKQKALNDENECTSVEQLKNVETSEHLQKDNEMKNVIYEKHLNKYLHENEQLETEVHLSNIPFPYMKELPKIDIPINIESFSNEFDLKKNNFMYSQPNSLLNDETNKIENIPCININFKFSLPAPIELLFNDVKEKIEDDTVEKFQKVDAGEFKCVNYWDTAKGPTEMSISSNSDTSSYEIHPTSTESTNTLEELTEDMDDDEQKSYETNDFEMTKYKTNENTSTSFDYDESSVELNGNSYFFENIKEDEPLPSLTQSKSSIFDAQFKIFGDEWSCNFCTYLNKSYAIKCTMCENPRKKTTMSDAGINEMDLLPIKTTNTFGLVSNNKDKWECNGCYLYNDNQLTKCVACGTMKTDTTVNSKQK